LIAHWNPSTGEQYHREFEPLFSAPLTEAPELEEPLKAAESKGQ
jgi:hypothetical protein